MKPLRPIVIAVLGAVLLGVAVTIAAVLTAPDARNAPRMLVWLITGAAMGLVIFVPIAVTEMFRSRLIWWLQPHWFRIQWFVSLTMAGAMGYVIASSVHKTFDPLTALAMVCVFLGAMTKVCLGILAKPEGDYRWWK
jgi:hypothetical protein